MAAWRDQPGGAPSPGRGQRDEDRTQLSVVEGEQPLNWRRGILVGTALISCLILLAIIAVLVITSTDWGRERVRRFAVDALGGMVHGRVTIGRLDGNLLSGVTAHDVTITDSAGKPFIAIESVSSRYSVMSLLRKRIWLDQVYVVRPLVVLDRLPKGDWNWQRIFPRDTTHKPVSQQQAWGDWIRFTNVSLRGGQLVVRTPWNPSERLSRTARDSAIRDALNGKGRLVIQRVPGGYQKTVQLDSVNAVMPLLRLAEPGIKDRLAEVSAMSMQAYPFRSPGAMIRDLKGAFSFNNDSAWWKSAYVEMPNSKANGSGSYVFASGDMTINAHTDPASFSDMRWVYPRLPGDGRGKLDLALAWRGALQSYTITNADITMAGSRTTGKFGITLGDTIAIHDTDLRFTGLDTRTIEQLIPNFKSPRRGTFAGHAIVSGGRHAMLVNGDVTFDDQRAGASRVVANGAIGFLDGGGVQARDLRVQLRPLQLEMAKTWKPDLPIGGTLTGNATVNGSTTSQLGLTMNLEQVDRGTRSVIEGRAAVKLAGTKSFDVDVVAQPVSLVEVGRFFPAAGLQGSAVGPIHVAGTLGNLRVNTDLRLPDGGRFDARGTLDLASRDKGYDLTAHLYTLNLRTLTTKGPVTSLTATAAVNGRGTQLATMRTTVAADLSTSRWDTLAVDTASVRATLANGLAQVQRLYAYGYKTAANVSGSFGLTRTTSGELKYNVAIDSLGALNRWLPKANANAPTTVRPRPRAAAQALARAREDSARIARATELQRALTGAPGPVLNVPIAQQTLRTDTLSGSLVAAGTLKGNIYDFDLRGRASGEKVVARGNFVHAFRTEYAWTNARTPQAKLAVGLDADSVSAMGFAFDSVSARVTYASPGGHAELSVLQGKNRQYAASGDYALYPDRRELRLANMTFRFDTTFWAMTRPSAVTWGGPGVRVIDLELKNRGDGRIYANGLLPTSGVADFRLDIDNFPVSNVADILQTDIEVAGVATLHGTMTGTLANPGFRGAFGLVYGTYNTTKVPITRGTFAYADRQLTSHIDLLRDDGRTMAVGDARIPINLALSGVTGDRLLPDPMTVDIVADSLPVELIPQFTDIVSNVHGRAFGRVAMRGTLRRPRLLGALALMNGTMMLNATGATFSDMRASVRMLGDTVLVDSVYAWAKGPVRLRGSLGIGNWREPAFNLYLTSEGAELMNNDRAKIRVDAGLALTGPFNHAYLSGAATVTQGVIYAPEPTGRHLIGAGDPALFNVLDTATVEDKSLFPAQSPLLANMRVDMTIAVKHNTWVRNREANIEVYTDEPVTVRDEAQSLTLTGVIATDRGEYNFLGKRFQISRGSAMFIGAPDLNPTLQITGEYQVQMASRGAVNIRVLIGGTLKRPRLSLESDAQPPKTQSELLSLLAFGQSTTSLLAFNSSSVAGSAASMDLFGVGAQYAVKRLASVALGVIVDQVEIQAGRAFGTDVFSITPGDVPNEIAGRGVGNFITQTKFEAGKYVNPRTFVTIQTQSYQFGGAVEHRTADGWRFTASIEPRIILSEPTLTTQPYRTVRAYGGLILREWRF
ncbi:MAG TPA: translocation/assembly module TamB domain-containing protein [Gemmatimonadaceae bacterium]